MDRVRGASVGVVIVRGDGGGPLAVPVAVAVEDEFVAADWSRSIADWRRSGNPVEASLPARMGVGVEPHL